MITRYFNGTVYYCQPRIAIVSSYQGFCGDRNQTNRTEYDTVGILI